MSKPAPHEPSRDFDFLFGRWKVRNRRLKERLQASQAWESFDAQQHCWPTMDGMGNMDEFVTDAFGDTHFIGMSLRFFDPRARTWSIHWVDNQRVTLEPPVVGRFENGVGTFYGDDQHNGTPVRARFVWTVDEQLPQWEQAFSTDDGQTWETNWIMAFERLPE